MSEDLIQNVQEVYKKWESRSRPSRGRLKNSYHNRSSSRNQHYEVDDSLSSFSRSLSQRTKRTPRHTVPKYDGLAEFKMAPSVVSFEKPRPFVGKPCAKCFTRSRACIEDETVYLLGVHNILLIPYFSFESLNICCLWNIFKIRSLISSHDTTESILKSKRVEDAMQDILNTSNEDEISSGAIADMNQNAKAIVNTLKSSVSSFCVTVTSFCLHHILRKIFSGIFVHKGQIEILKTLSKDGIPFVYLPLYRSYFDFILVPYVLHMNMLKTPFFIVPDDLYVPLLSLIFKLLGAIFVDKTVNVKNSDSDILYDAIVKTYIEKCLESGHDIEMFLESCRSISGKPQTPDTNLLSAIVESVSKGSIDDANIVPVSIIYEATDGNFITDQLRMNSKERSSLYSKILSLWKMMHFRYGNVRVNFNQPFSIKEFLQSSSARQPKLKYSCSSPDSLSSDVANEKCNATSTIKATVNDLAMHVMHDAITCTSLMSTHLLAFLLVTQYRKGGTQQQLQNSMDWLRGEIQRKKCDVGFTGESLPVIKRAVDLLGKDLITCEIVEMEWTSSDMENNNVKVKIYTPVVKLPHVLELQYYANAVVPLFLKESIVVNALYAIVDVDICHFHHCDSRFYVSRERLIDTAVRLSEILQEEFIINPPCEDIVTSFNDAIDALIEKECLLNASSGDVYLKPKKKASALSFEISSDEEGCDEVTDQQLKIDLREESISHLEFLRNILSPYIESYWLAACSLLKLIDEVKEEKAFIREMQMTAQEKLYKGLLGYEESFSVEILKNSLKMFNTRHIIEYYIEGSIRTICLSDAFNSFECVNEIIANIEDFRK